MTFAEEIEQAAGGDAIEAIVIGSHGDWSFECEQEDGWLEPGQARYISETMRGMVLSWEKARSMLDYEYDPSHGSADCHAIWAWTASRVLFVHEYDGSTSVVFVPRNPTAGIPSMSGNYPQ